MAIEQLSRHGETVRGSPPWLMIDWLLAAFSEHHSEATRRYMDFVANGRNQPELREKSENRIFRGSDEFVERLPRTLASDASYREIPAAQRRPTPKPLTQIAGTHGRDQASFDAYASGGYSLKEIGDHFGLHYSQESRIVKQHRLARSKT